MSFTFRPAKRQNVGLIIGLSAPSGGGKTWTAMTLAKGMAQGKKFCVIDTEAGRALHYADYFDFDHGDLHAPFSPANYTAAITAADAAGYPVIIVDSASHEWAGEGGILDMQEAELKRMGGGENIKMASWIKPKSEHKRMVQKLLQVRAHVILCFRAESKIDMVKDDRGKSVVVPKKTLTSIEGWIPICEKSLPFELTASFLLLPDAPGVPRPIKLQEQHREFFPSGRTITEAAGSALSKWAAGGTAAPESYTGLVTVKAPRKSGALMVHEFAIDEQVMSTVDPAVADTATNYGGKRATVTFSRTAKGGLMLLSITQAQTEAVA